MKNEYEIIEMIGAINISLIKIQDDVNSLKKDQTDIRNQFLESVEDLKSAVSIDNRDLINKLYTKSSTDQINYESRNNLEHNDIYKRLEELEALTLMPKSRLEKFVKKHSWIFIAGVILGFIAYNVIRFLTRHT